jgi:hypothetical protein
MARYNGRPRQYGARTATFEPFCGLSRVTVLIVTICVTHVSAFISNPINQL